MFIRPTQIEDLDAAMALYDHARQYMRAKTAMTSSGAAATPAGNW